MLTMIESPPLDLPPLPGLIVRVPAGYPSPAQDYDTERIDLAAEIVRDPEATFYLRVTDSGTSMTGVGIFPGDILVVDRSVQARDGSIVVAAVDGEWTVKRLRVTETGVELRPENPRFAAVRVGSLSELTVFGVVRRVIHEPI